MHNFLLSVRLFCRRAWPWAKFRVFVRPKLKRGGMMVAFRWGSATSDQGGERRGGHVHPWMARRQTVGMAKFAPLIERRRTQGRRRENVGWGFAKQIYIYIYIVSSLAAHFYRNILPKYLWICGIFKVDIGWSSSEEIWNLTIYKEKKKKKKKANKANNFI